MKIGIISCGPGLPEVVNIYGHSSNWIPEIINDSTLEFIVKKIYDNQVLSIEEADAWIITGSKYSVYDKILWMKKLESFIIQLANESKSILGICFGHQIIAQALGGKVEKNIKGWELGSYNISLTKEAIGSPLFISFNSDKIVYESHQDVVVKLPTNAIELAYTKKGNQAYSINENIFGVQFHPEFSYDIARALMDIRINKGIKIDNPNLIKSNNGKDILLNYVRFLKERI